MKFNEKLIELRKKQGLSQEELGDKLNITRQTVSKWELGQTTPEMDKLIEIGKIFNISVDELINESDVETNVNPIIEDQPITTQKTRDKKVLIIILIALVGIIILMGIKLFSAFSAFNLFGKNAEQILGAVTQEEVLGEESQNLFHKIFKLLNKEIDKQLNDQESIEDEGENLIQEATNKINVEIFNGDIELYNGSNSGLQLKKFLEEIITKNKKEDKKITVKYLETETQDAEEIKNVKTTIKESNNFEVTFDYDEQGYINKVTIEKVFSEFEIKAFNNPLELYAGTGNGMIVTNVLDKIITNNKTKDQRITVKYREIETQNEDEIKNIKKKFGTFDNCEITYEYDAKGFINKAIIEKI